jgi:hypothetical protein
MKRGRQGIVNGHKFSKLLIVGWDERWISEIGKDHQGPLIIYGLEINVRK